MSLDIKSFVKENFVVSTDKTSVTTDLQLIHVGDWVLARKSENKQDIYALKDSEFFVEVTFVRSGEYHSGYTYSKPTFSFVEKRVETKIFYPELDELKDKALELKSKYFDKDDETSLVPVYSSNWQREDKINYLDTVYSIDGTLLKQTLFGNSDWTEFVEYSIVEREEKEVVTYKKIK